MEEEEEEEVGGGSRREAAQGEGMKPKEKGRTLVVVRSTECSVYKCRSPKGKLQEVKGTLRQKEATQTPVRSNLKP